MRFSLQIQYAICGMFDIAYNGSADPVPAQAIGERQGIPARYLEQILAKLRKAELVRSKRGPGGGYSLARPAAEISVADVIEAVGGPLAHAWSPDAGTGTPFAPGFLWPDLSERLGAVLRASSLEGLCRQAARAGVERVGSDDHMYFI